MIFSKNSDVVNFIRWCEEKYEEHNVSLEHIRLTAFLAVSLGGFYNTDSVEIVAYAHDLLEDTNVSIDELEKVFILFSYQTESIYFLVQSKS